MNEKCPVCNLIINNHEKEIQCDTCKLFIHSLCTNLTRIEKQCLKEKKRNINFNCEQCSTISNAISDLKTMICSLKDDISSLKNELQTLKKEKATEINLETIINEIRERDKRSCNIIVENVKESDKTNKSERYKDDNRTILNILEDIKINVGEIKTFRLGTFSENKPRATKVIFENKKTAINILKNRNLVKIPGIRIYSDKTKIERDYFNKIKTELEHFKNNGDIDKTIKYINNIPTIINKKN